MFAIAVLLAALGATSAEGVRSPLDGQTSERLAQGASSRLRVGGFWGEQYKMLTCHWLPHCIRAMEAGGEGQEMTNFTGAKFHGCKWSDAYPYNVVEAASLALEIDPGDDAEWRKGQDFLRQKIDAWIPLFLAVQEPSGYIDNYTRLRKAPHFRNTGDHEFYVMGYFIEMGLAHYRMTGGKDRRLFDAAIRCADHLDATFGPPPKRTWMNGHPGLELALQRLAEATGEKRYADLAKWFVLHQHTQKENQSGYNQADVPAAQMTNACGHAVRANYFYTAMAEIDETKPAAKRLFESIVDRKMYLTGGVGSDYRKEAYGADYDLPQFAYAESCAGCGLAFFARAMASGRRRFAFTTERTTLSSPGRAVIGRSTVSRRRPIRRGRGRRRARLRVPTTLGSIRRFSSTTTARSTGRRTG